MPRLPHPKHAFSLDFSPLRQRRRFLNLSQGDLAKVAGINPTTLSRTEQNVTSPSLEQLVSLARALGTPMTQLFVVVDAP